MILSSLLFVGFLLVVLPAVATYSKVVIGVSDSPDTVFIPGSIDLYQLAEAYGAIGRRTYIGLRWTFDLVWPLVYTWFLISWIKMLSDRLSLKGVFGKLYLLPFVGTGLDYLENIGATLIMGLYPMKLVCINRVTPYVTFTKWAVIGLTFTLYFVLLIVWLVKVSRRKRVH